jgi:hypothetical protein
MELSDSGNQMEEPGVFLPTELLTCASRRGNEYAWRKRDLLAVAASAELEGLASGGWQVQFRTPDGECALCWKSFYPGERRADEPWPQYVGRSWEEARQMWQELFDNEETVDEGRRIFRLIQETEDGLLPRDALWFILYFRTSSQNIKVGELNAGLEAMGNGL